MAQIKSALELALENTADIVGDKAAIKRKELEEQGRRLASKFLFDPETTSDELAKALKETKKEDRGPVKTSTIEVLLSNITLPREEVDEELLKRIEEGIAVVTGEKKQATNTLDQLTQFFQQYLQNREQILDHLKRQYQPQLDAKQEALSRQYGQKVALQPEQDPDFMQLLNRNIGRLEEQYQQALDQAKGEIRELLKL
ncbi:DUF6657 family protein [Sediminispirochaeta smaragdinae]|jgi:hypothetical protein|uniref:Uncharacterized protein n=1 Tax=Sediminispirochaeta smaragdinae (strain DSM 11293 / JCM 15392 / SEBR 4228) TaxID=573413 RepID=E1RCC9_SEDSS|nr:DUF6657 family protein [Sediminispirochaeta smaragdinae]ADK80009.1 conserved hypothetical protein [Sediminispirochaeta smaragdinae DSM 11293]